MIDSGSISVSQWLRRLKDLKKSGLLVHTSTYFASTLLVQAIGFISLPILTRLLSVSEFGTLDVWRGYISVLLAALTLNSYTALGRYYYEEREDFKEFFGTSFLLVLLLTGIFAFLAMALATPISHLLGLPVAVIPFIAPIVLFSAFSSWFEQIFIPQKKSSLIATRNIFNTLTLLTLAILLIRQLSASRYMGYIYAQAVVGLVFSFYYFKKLKGYLKLSFRMEHLKYILHYSLPLLPYSLGGVLLNYFDRIMINRYYGPKFAGLYGFAYNVGMLLPAFVGAVSRAWMPDYFSLMNRREFSRLNQEAVRVFSLICVAALFLIYFSKEIGMILVPNRYYDSINIIPVIVIGYLFSAMYSFYGWSFDYSKKTALISLIMIFSSVLNIGLNIWLLPIYGYKAAAWTTLVSYLIMALVAWITSRLLLSIHVIPIGPILRVLFRLLPFCLIFEGLQLVHIHPTFETLAKLILFFLFALLTYRRTLEERPA